MVPALNLIDFNEDTFLVECVFIGHVTHAFSYEILKSISLHEFDLIKKACNEILKNLVG